MSINIVYKVEAHSLNVREQPNASSRIVGPVLSNGAQVTVTEIQKDSLGNSWGKHSAGWSSITYGKNVWMKQVSTQSAPETKQTPVSTVDDKDLFIDQSLDRLASQLSNISSIADTLGNPFQLKSARSILGLPHQFMWTVDRRIRGSAYGRLFTDNIIMDMPICTIVPGGPRFLTGKTIGKKQRESLSQFMVETFSSPVEDVGSFLEDILGEKNARYYSFQTQYPEYMRYVNTLTRTMARYLGIHKESLRSGSARYDLFDWRNENMESDRGRSIMEFVGEHGAINFYYDKAGTGMSETSSNTTDRSMLENALSGASNTMKEVDFLLGAGAGMKVMAMDAENKEQVINALSEDIARQNTTSLFSGIINNLQAGITTTVAGANMLLPEIWRDSLFTRMYTLELHLASPYGDPEAFYLNVGVPLSFILPLAFPRQFGANGYYSPFIIQAFSKGVFSCEMGIVESVSIARFGSGDSMSRTGLPLEVRVSITFKQLYNSLSVANDSNYAIFVNNIGLLDFIANISGVNLNEPEIVRKMNLWLNSKINKLRDIPGNIQDRLYDRFRDSMLNLLKF